ncbi:MAG TPA: hypothetical protein VIA82_05715 [Candidatus Limnocylindria bacterium]|jgi:hypothetical protein
MRRLELVAISASVVTAVLYVLVGFEVLYVGESTSGTDPGLLGFGLSAAAVFFASAGLLAMVERRWAWIAVALLNAVVIVGYFAMAGVREPPFEWPGLAIKALQLITLVAVVALALPDRSVARPRMGAHPRPIG